MSVVLARCSRVSRTMRLRRTKDLARYTIGAIDTDIGSVSDLYFDDQRWTIRYLVVATGIIFSGRKVLISLLALRHPVWSPLHIYVNLTAQQVQDSPSIDLHKPVSRQHEMENLSHYDLPFYWEGTDVWGLWPHPQELVSASRKVPRTEFKALPAETHLRSAREIAGYHVMAVDGEIGHVEDFLFDDETWGIRYAIVDTKNWWLGKKILLRPEWIKRLSWEEREIYTDLDRASIRNSPEWNPDAPVSREYELHLHQHYGYPPYWIADESSKP